MPPKSLPNTHSTQQSSTETNNRDMSPSRKRSRSSPTTAEDPTASLPSQQTGQTGSQNDSVKRAKTSSSKALDSRVEEELTHGQGDVEVNFVTADGQPLETAFAKDIYAMAIEERDKNSTNSNDGNGDDEEDRIQLVTTLFEMANTAFIKELKEAGINVDAILHAPKSPTKLKAGSSSPSAKGKEKDVGSNSLNLDKTQLELLCSQANCLEDFAEYIHFETYLQQALNIYAAVLLKDPTNAQANVGYGRCKLYQLKEQYSQSAGLSEDADEYEDDDDEDANVEWVTRHIPEKEKDTLISVQNAFETSIQHYRSNVHQHTISSIEIATFYKNYFLAQKSASPTRRSYLNMRQTLYNAIHYLVQAEKQDKSYFNGKNGSYACELWGTCLYYLGELESKVSEVLLAGGGNEQTKYRSVAQAPWKVGPPQLNILGFENLSVMERAKNYASKSIELLEKSIQLVDDETYYSHYEILGQAYLLLSVLLPSTGKIEDDKSEDIGDSDEEDDEEMDDDDEDERAILEAYDAAIEAFKKVLEICPEHEGVQRQLMELGVLEEDEDEDGERISDDGEDD